MIRRDGPQALTLDAVAAEAGVSKGGLLYHFASKRELLDAVVRRWLDEFQDDIDAAGPGFLPATCAPPTAPRPRRRACWRRSSPTPTCWPSCATGTRRGGDRVVTEGGDPVEATVARLAADGLWLADLLGMAPPRASCAPAYWRACSNCAIDSSVNEVGSRNHRP